MQSDKDEIFMDDGHQSFEKEQIKQEFSKPSNFIKKSWSSNKIFEIFLTYEQYQFIKTNLPIGYSLREKKKKKKISFSMALPTKKIHNDHPKQLFQKNYHNNHIQKEQRQITNFEPIVDNTTFNNAYNSFTELLPIPEEDHKRIEMAVKKFKPENAFLRKCYKIILQLKSHPKSRPFLEPVDPVALNIPDYPLIVKEPMDLGTIEKKILKEIYKSHVEFMADVQKVWNNSFLYNPKNTHIYLMTLEMKEFFEKILNEEHNDRSKESFNPGKKIDSLIANIENIFMLKQNQTNLYLHFHDKLKNSTGKNFVSIEEKKNLRNEILSLKPFDLIGALEILYEGKIDPSLGEMEIDLFKIEDEKLRMTQKYIELIRKNNQQRNHDKEKKKKRNESNKVIFPIIIKFNFSLRKKDNIMKI